MTRVWPYCVLLLVASFDVSVCQGARNVIMAVFPHADDELDVAPLLSTYARRGDDVFLVIATRGEKGVREHAGIPAGDSLATIRMEEARCVCVTLGIHPPIFLGLDDKSLMEHITGAPLREKLDSVFRQYRPDVVITWGPDGGYGHPDHRMVHNVVTEIFQSGLSPRPTALYYTAIPTEHWRDSPELKTGTARWVNTNWKPVKKEYLTVRVRCDSTDLGRAMQSVYCYRSQYTPDEMEDSRSWLVTMNRDTVYLRPFIPQPAVSYDVVK